MQDYDLLYEKYVATQEARQQLAEMWEQQQQHDADQRYAAMELRENYLADEPDDY